MRSRTLFDRHGAFAEYVDGELVWVRENSLEGAAAKGPQILSDLRPYRSMIDGSIVDGRKRHRDHLKAHGCVEIGNDASHLDRKAVQITGRKESLHRMLGDVSERELQGMIKREIRNRK